MEIKTKQTIFGSVVIVCLAIIFVPMLFQSHQTAQNMQTVAIPAPPPANIQANANNDAITTTASNQTDINNDTGATVDNSDLTTTVANANNSGTTNNATQNTASSTNTSSDLRQMQHVVTSEKTAFQHMVSDDTSAVDNLKTSDQTNPSTTATNAQQNTTQTAQLQKPIASTPILLTSIAKPSLRSIPSATITTPNQQKKTAGTTTSHSRTNTGTLATTPANWSVQVGSFANPKHAKALIAELKAEGYHPYTRQKRTASGKQITRVFIGRYDRKPEAIALRKTLLGQTQKAGFVVQQDAS